MEENLCTSRKTIPAEFQKSDHKDKVDCRQFRSVCQPRPPQMKYDSSWRENCRKWDINLQTFKIQLFDETGTIKEFEHCDQDYGDRIQEELEEKDKATSQLVQ